MHPKKNSVSIVISNFNSEELLRKNLSKISDLQQNTKNNILEIVIVDDGSTDGSAKYIKENFPKIRLIKHKINRGIAAAFNTGVRTARGELILAISTDMIPDKSLSASLIPHFDDPKVFAVSFHEEGLGPEAGFWKDGFIKFRHKNESDEVQKCFYVRKGEGMFSRKIWIELGGMDEKLFLPFYWEDLDLGYRALKHGYKNLWDPGAKVAHEHWGTIGKFPKNIIAEKGEVHMLYFIWKNIHSANLFRKHIAELFIKILKNPGYIKIIVEALTNIGTVLKLRRKEIKDSKISDEAVFARFSA